MHEDAPHQTGATVRGYRIERLIGTGGAAAVYEVRQLGQRGPGERMACKVLHTTQRNEPQHREQARQEAVLGLRITAGHPNLVAILDFFDDTQARHCIVMELVDGASVAELRGPDRRLPIPVVRRIAVEVLEALAYLHDKGVLHRDLSPRNVLVTADGAVKVTDFGCARVMEQGLVHTKTLRATAMYAASEAIQLLPLDARADLFALGAVLYDLVAGMPPCGDQDMLSKILAANAAGRFAPLPRDTPADLAELIRGLIRIKRNERRPQTAAEALALLRDHGQPMATEEELAGLVAAARARGGQELADECPSDVLPAGHVLVPRDVQETADSVAERLAGRSADARPALMAGDAADAVPHHIDDDEPLPEGMGERVIDVAAEPVRDVAAQRAPDVAPGRVTASMPGRADEDADRPRPARHSVARRAVLVAVSLACALVLGFWLRGRWQGAPTASERTLPSETPTPVLVPAPAPPVSPIVVTPVPVQEAPRHTTEPPDGPRHERIEVQRRAQRARRPAVRRQYVPSAREWPPWVQR